MENIENILKGALKNVLVSFSLNLDENIIVIEKSKNKEHGDYATNLAMRLTKVLKDNPINIANKIMSVFNCDSVEKIEIAGPGFINFFIKSNSLCSLVSKVINQGEHFGDNNMGEGKRINVEYVSANPTGDLHLGHARGAAMGDSIARLYKKCGYITTREYYINDAGNQIDNLALSLIARYKQLFNIEASLPENGYHAEDIVEIAKKIKDEIGDAELANPSIDYFKNIGKYYELEKIKNDLKLFRVEFDVYTSELDIRKSGAIEKVLEDLRPHCYMSEGALFLKTTDYGDDKDRVLIKSDGSYTYLLPDIAYHLDKLHRNNELLIDLLGADHHGYVARMKASLQIEGYKASTLEVEMVQMVRLFKNGEEYKMSKRTGNAVSLRELVEEVGVDSARYFFISRAGSSHLDFDLDLAKTMSSVNPVYYAQYAHARLASVISLGSDYKIDESGQLNVDEAELEVLKCIDEFESTVKTAALERAPQKIASYTQTLATLINNFYTKCRIIDSSNVELTSARLGLAKAAKIVLKNALNLIGVDAPDYMESLGGKR